MPDSHRPAHRGRTSRRALQHRLRDVQLAALHSGERRQGGRGVRQQRRPMAGLQQDSGPRELGQRGRRRTGHRVHEARAPSVPRLPASKASAGVGRRGDRGEHAALRASSNAPVPMSAGTRRPDPIAARRGSGTRAALRASMPRWARTAAATEPACSEMLAVDACPAAESTWSAWVSARSRSPARSAASARREASSTAGAPAPTAAANSAPAPGIDRPATASSAPPRRTRSAARAAGHTGAEQTAGGGEDPAAAVELALGQRCGASPAASRAGCARDDRGRDQRDRQHAVRR